LTRYWKFELNYNRQPNKAKAQLLPVIKRPILSISKVALNSVDLNSSNFCYYSWSIFFIDGTAFSLFCFCQILFGLLFTFQLCWRTGSSHYIEDLLAWLVFFFQHCSFPFFQHARFLRSACSSIFCVFYKFNSIHFAFITVTFFTIASSVLGTQV